jgi:hypothetical protein
MKKKYITPTADVVRVEFQHLILGSGVTGKRGTTIEIEYGGVDEDGSKDPSSDIFNAWDEESWDNRI